MPDTLTRPITPERFWSAFATELRKAIADPGSNWPTVFSQDKSWTSLMNSTVLTRLGDSLGFAKYRNSILSPVSNEWCRVDVGYFTIREPLHRFDGNWDWEVAIEHENQAFPSWLDEFVKLTHINCGLKVLITYHNYRSGATISDELRVAKDFYDCRKYRQQDDAWLLVFGQVWDEPLTQDFVAYKFDGREFEELAPQKIILT